MAAINQSLIWSFDSTPINRYPSADFNEVSKFSANPARDTGIFKFDLKMNQVIHNARFHWEGDVYVNSNDATYAVFGNPDFLPNLINPDKDLHVDFVIIRPTSQINNMLICCRHRVLGKVCVKYGTEYSKNTNKERLSLEVIAFIDFYNNIKSTMQNVLIAPLENRRADTEFTKIKSRPTYHEDAAYQHWLYDNEPSPIATQQPLLGLFVGIIKHYPDMQNRVLASSVSENFHTHQNLITHLKRIFWLKQGMIFDNSAYKLLVPR